jgi:hypothetical protein
MRCISRWLFLAAVAVVACSATTRAAEVDPLLPKETEQVFHVNMKQILDSDIIKKYALGQIKQALQGEQVQKVLEPLGVDPLKDVERMTAGIWGKDQSDMNTVAVLRGKFDAKKLFDGAKDFASKNPDKVSLDEESDFKMVKIVGDNGKPFFVSVADATTIIGGTDKKMVAASLNAFNKKEKAALAKGLSDLVLKQDEKASMFYCALVEGKLAEIPDSAFDQLQAVGVNGATMKKQLQNMSTMAMTVRLGKEAAMDITMGMKDEDSAEEFGGKAGNLTKLIDTARTFMPIIAGQQPKAKPVIDELVKTLESKVKGKDVTIKLAVSADAIGKAAKQDE